MRAFRGQRYLIPVACNQLFGGEIIAAAKAEQLRCTSVYFYQVPAACVVVEDSPHGVRAARSAGMKAVGFQNIHSGNQDLSQAHLVIEDFTEENIQKVIRLAL